MKEPESEAVADSERRLPKARKVNPKETPNPTRGRKVMIN